MLPLSPLFARLIAADQALRAAEYRLQAAKNCEDDVSANHLQSLRSLLETIGIHRARKDVYEAMVTNVASSASNSNANCWISRFGVVSTAESLRLLELAIWTQQFDTLTGEPLRRLPHINTHCYCCFSAATRFVDCLLLPRRILAPLLHLIDYHHHLTTLISACLLETMTAASNRTVSSITASSAQSGQASNESGVTAVLREHILLLLALLSAPLIPLTAVAALLEAFAQPNVIQLCQQHCKINLITALSLLYSSFGIVPISSPLSANTLSKEDDLSTAQRNYLTLYAHTAELLREPIQHTNKLLKQLFQNTYFINLSRLLKISLDAPKRPPMSPSSAPSATTTVNVLSTVISFPLPSPIFLSQMITQPYILLPLILPFLHLSQSIRDNYTVSCDDLIPSLASTTSSSSEPITLSDPGVSLLTSAQSILSQSCNLHLLHSATSSLSGFMYRYPLPDTELACLHWLLLKPINSDPTYRNPHIRYLFQDISTMPSFTVDNDLFGPSIRSYPAPTMTKT